MFSKIRHFVNFRTLKSIYHPILQSHLNYLLTFWDRNVKLSKRLLVTQKKSLRIMHFIKRNTYTSNLLKNLNILKLPDKVSHKSCVLICEYLNQSLPKSFKNLFTLQQLHIHVISWVALKHLLIKQKYMEDIQSI